MNLRSSEARNNHQTPVDKKGSFSPSPALFHTIVCRVSREGGGNRHLLSNQTWTERKSCTSYDKVRVEGELVKWERVGEVVTRAD